MKRTTVAALLLPLLAAGLAAWLLLRGGEERAAEQVLRARPADEAAAPAFEAGAPAAPSDASHAVPAVEAQPLAPVVAVPDAQAKRTLEGVTLRAADRTPIANISLWVPSQPARVVHSGADGSFSLDNVPGDLELFAESGYRKPPLHVALKPPDGGPLLGLEVVLDTGWVLPGEVRDAAGHALPGAHVVVDDDRPWETELASQRAVTPGVSREAKSGADGSFRVLDIPYAPDAAGQPLRLHARASAPGYATQLLPVDVPPGPQVARPVEFRLTRGGAVAGRISSPDDEPVLCGKVALVYVSTPQSADFAPRGLTAETASEGRYRIEGVPPGRYVLAAWGGSAGAGPSNRFDAPRFVSDVTVREGDTTVVDLVLASDRVLEGLVVDASGNPVADAQVELREHVLLEGGDGSSARFIFGEGALRAVDEDGRHATEIAHKLAAATTDGNGRFRFEALCAGSKRLIARKPGDTALGWALRDVTLDPLVPSEPVTLVLPRALRLAGRVLDESGLPVPGATVENWNSAFPYENPAATTDAEGRFALAIEGAGSIMLGVSAEGFTDTSESLELTSDRDDLQLRLTHSPAVRGVVLDAATLQPVTSYGLTLLGPHSVVRTSVQAADGAFRLEWGDEGTLSVFITAEGYAAAERHEVDPKATVAEPLRVLLERK
ncbi:MAG TPA: carboxypeptidase-like regulatory domain-containing protein [Planctomycetota bacterium]|nr:carboxypeptidase-like regulatory domain-containing protein [Planctomycetota bacterium]